MYRDEHYMVGGGVLLAWGLLIHLAKYPYIRNVVFKIPF